MKLDFNDILILPKATSKISSRSEINIYQEFKLSYRNFDMLPLITAPMDTVINLKNTPNFISNKIIACTPRNENIFFLGCTINSYSITEAEKLYYSNGFKPYKYYLIDIANGHMESLEILVRKIKNLEPNCFLMVGNIANPQTYTKLSNAGADFIRIGIGNGGGCLTTQHTGVGFPMASLIKECYQESLWLEKPAYIVADGGMQSYSDIIKALALGADFVMMGSILNKCLESAGDNYLWKKIKISQKFAEKAYKWGLPVYKKFRGMSTKEVQKKWGASKLKTSEGVVRFRKVEYTLNKWVENFEDYLRSAMSYCGASNLKEFIGRAETIQISDNAYKRFNK